MKREEKNQQTRRRILDRALEEFSRQGYGASSINAICAAQDISKGIVYHYFETKDTLFLACVAECFRRLTEFIQENMAQQGGPACCLGEYFAVRTRFFQSYPVYQRIFCEAVISPPAHLRDEIQRCKQDFDELNLRILKRLLAPLSLRPGISQEEVLETFRQFQDFINIRFQTADAGGQDFEAREEQCRRTLDILLYGVIEREAAHHA